MAIFAGESVAGEASWGSLRYLLARPVIETSGCSASKVRVAGLFSLAAVPVVSVTGLVSGVAAFGWHPLFGDRPAARLTLLRGVTTFSPFAALGRIGWPPPSWRAPWSRTFGFAILCSTLTDRPFAAVAGGVLLTFVSRALDNVPGLHALGPWLPITDNGAGLWTEVLFQPTDLGGYPHLAVVQAAYTVVFLVGAGVWFTAGTC